MVIAVAAFGLALHPDRQAVGTGIGSAAPTPRRAPRGRGVPRRAELRLWESRGDAARRRWPRSSASWSRAAASPIDDVRGTAAYRRHALAVMARRTLTWAWTDYQDMGRGRLMRVTFTVNGERREADDVWEGESLLYVLRERMGLPGSKNACEQGECGSCTVYLDGVAGLRLPGRRRAGRGPRRASPSRGWPTARASCTRSSRRSSRPAPSSAASARRACSSQTHDLLARDPDPDRRRDPRGAGRQPVPLHRLREDPRRRAAGRRADGGSSR